MYKEIYFDILVVIAALFVLAISVNSAHAGSPAEIGHVTQINFDGQDRGIR